MVIFRKFKHFELDLNYQEKALLTITDGILTNRRLVQQREIV